MSACSQAAQLPHLLDCGPQASASPSEGQSRDGPRLRPGREEPATALGGSRPLRGPLQREPGPEDTAVAGEASKRTPLCLKLTTRHNKRRENFGLRLAV